MAWVSTVAALALMAVLGLAAGCLQIRDGGFWAQGVVVDADGRPVSGASVKTRAYTAVTDRRGCFRLFEITAVDRHQMPFSVDALGSKNFIGTLAAPGALRVRVELANETSATATVVVSSPAAGALLSCEPPRTAPWHQESAEEVAGSTLITALSELPAHLGEYPCRNGVLESPVLRAALREVLGQDFEAYLEHVERSGCAPVAERGSWIVLDVSQVYYTEGGGTSFILVGPRSGQVYVVWVPWIYTDGRKARVYGPQPVPRDVATIVIDELTLSLGHDETFSWRDGVVQIKPRNDRPLSILERPQPSADARFSLELPFPHSVPCPPDRQPPATVRAALGPRADRLVIHRYDKSRWSTLKAVASVVHQMVDAIPEKGRLHRFQKFSADVPPLISASVEFKGLRVWPIEFAADYVHVTDEDGCEWWGRYPTPSRRSR